MSASPLPGFSLTWGWSWITRVPGRRRVRPAGRFRGTGAGETILIAAAVYAGAGRLSVVGVGLIAFLAAVIGDNLGYAIGHLGGRALVLRYGRCVMLTSERLDKAEGFFCRHGGKVVVAARFIEGLRQANGIVAGTARMPCRQFLMFNALGAALWVGVWTSVGYLAGNHIGAIYTQVTRYSLYVLIGLGTLALVLVTRAVIRHRGTRKPAAEEHRHSMTTDHRR